MTLARATAAHRLFLRSLWIEGFSPNARGRPRKIGRKGKKRWKQDLYLRSGMLWVSVVGDISTQIKFAIYCIFYTSAGR